MKAEPFQAEATIAETLKKWGHQEFREGQEEAICHLLAGHDVLVVLPTGSGKSLIYQLAALHRPGLTLVISPLIALMQDQVDGLQERGVAAAFLNSTLSNGQLAERLEQMAAGAYKIVYVTPERLRQEQFREQIAGLEIGLLAVDEAHSVSEWGHDFRPDYLHIADFRQRVGNPPTAALTATAARRIQQEIERLLGLEQVRRVTASANRPNLHLQVRLVEGEEPPEEIRLRLLEEIFRERPNTTAIVYTGTRSNTEEVAAFLRETLQLEAKAYHAGVGDRQRSQVQEEFLEGQLPIVVATNAFGMGIDRADVRLVLHHTLPGSIEAYYQEAGRAGRDGQPAEAILLYHRNDRRLHEYFVNQSDQTYQDLHSLYQRLRQAQEEADSGAQFTVDVTELGRNGQVQVGLERLEEAGVVQQGLYEGNEQDILLLEWNEEAVGEVAERLKQFRERQLAQLGEMVEYAENRLDCRRKTLLAHFEEAAPAEVGQPGCCDICAGKQQVAAFVAEIKEEAAAGEELEPPPPLEQTIRACVRAFDGLRTVEQMVDLLHGDEAGHNRFRDSDYHGQLVAYSRAEIQAALDRLLDEGKLVVTRLETVSQAGSGEDAPPPGNAAELFRPASYTSTSSVS